MIRVEKKEYHGWKNAYAISNGAVDLIVSADVGPRVLHLGFSGGENQFHEFSNQAGLTGGNEFRLYGGHRLWAWPEIARTYYPDNRAVEVRKTAEGVELSAEIEDEPPGTRLKKQVTLRLDASGSHVALTHTISNLSSHATRLAPWTPTIMKPRGRAILPFPPRAAMDAQHYQSVGHLAIWPFTDFTDGRWILGPEFLQLQQCEKPSGRFQEQMTGLYNPAEWGAYFRAGFVFVKRAALIAGGEYPDFGCNFEVFTNPEFLELETLGPIVNLQPGESVAHSEDWWLFGDVKDGTGDSWVKE